MDTAPNDHKSSELATKGNRTLDRMGWVRTVLGVLLVVILGLAACGPEYGATPPPTHTPYPTYTPQPTYTPYPTATSQPTPTLPLKTPTIPPTPPAAAPQSHPTIAPRSRSSPTPPPTLTPPPPVVATPSPTPTPPPPSPTPQAQAPVATQLTPTPTPEKVEDPIQRHREEKDYALELINKARAQDGKAPVKHGDNIAAQLHAEASLRNCTAGHWGRDGLKPYMRYSLAGGAQPNAENVSGLHYCITAADRFAPVGDIKEEIATVTAALKDSTGHRANILDSSHRKVNIGLAWDRYNLMLVQHFEGDYVAYERLPTIVDGELTMSGRFKNGAGPLQQDIRVSIEYDPPPAELSRKQLARTYCYEPGEAVAFLRKPLATGWEYPNDVEVLKPQIKMCIDPYTIEPGAGPKSVREADNAYRLARVGGVAQNLNNRTIHWQTATAWEVDDRGFAIETGLPPELRIAETPGVYTVVIWASVDGEPALVSQYSMFVGIVPPDTYGHWGE